MPTLAPHVWMSVPGFFLGIKRWEREGRGVCTEDNKPLSEEYTSVGTVLLTRLRNI
jgi:hypothetical protein